MRKAIHSTAARASRRGNISTARRLLAAMLLTGALVASTTQADGLRCAGIAGNSGEQGATLVRFGPGDDGGLGVVHDRHGSLWSRGGIGVLNRYAPDGRLLAAYKLPKTQTNRNTDSIALAGDTIMLRLGKGLHTLPIDAPAGSEAKPLNVEADLMSPSSHDGWVAAAKGEEVFLVKTDGERKPVATPRQEANERRAWRRRLRILRNGKGNPEDSSGISRWLQHRPGRCHRRTARSSSKVSGMAQAGTARSAGSTPSRGPDPGVVLAGPRGLSLATWTSRESLSIPRGLAKINPSLFAVSGVAQRCFSDRMEGTGKTLRANPPHRRDTGLRRPMPRPGRTLLASCRKLGLE